MTERQKELLFKMGAACAALAQECMDDAEFHEVIIANNDLIPMSLDALGAEWYAVAEGEERVRIDAN